MCKTFIDHLPSLDTAGTDQPGAAIACLVPPHTLSIVPSAQVHGSAPDIAGQDIANPMAMVLSAAMMCRYGLQLPQARICKLDAHVLLFLCMLALFLHCAPAWRDVQHHAALIGACTCSPETCGPWCLQVADQLEAAIKHVLDQGYRTGDLMTDGMKQIGCSELGNVIEEYLQKS